MKKLSLPSAAAIHAYTERRSRIRNFPNMNFLRTPHDPRKKQATSQYRIKDLFHSTAQMEYVERKEPARKLVPLPPSAWEIPRKRISTLPTAEEAILQDPEREKWIEVDKTTDLPDFKPAPCQSWDTCGKVGEWKCRKHGSVLRFVTKSSRSRPREDSYHFPEQRRGTPRFFLYC